MMSRLAKRIRARWGFVHDRVYKTLYQGVFPAGEITPLFIVGCQRSGTNMLTRVLNKPGSTWTYNEGNNPAFARYRIRADETIQHLIARSRAQHILFKPLCDSQWTDRLLTLHPNAKAIWIYRDYRDVARSAVKHWGSHQRQVIMHIVAGNLAGAGWQADRIQPRTHQIVNEVVTPNMSDMDGAVIKWLIRNQLFFDLQLADNPRIILLQYADLVCRPHVLFPRLFQQLNIPFKEQYIKGIFDSSVGQANDTLLQPPIAKQAQQLLEQFHACYAKQEIARD